MHYFSGTRKESSFYRSHKTVSSLDPEIRAQVLSDEDCKAVLLVTYEDLKSYGWVWFIIIF